MCPVSVWVQNAFEYCTALSLKGRGERAQLQLPRRVEGGRHLKVLPEYYQQISRSTALSSYTTFRVVNQLAFLLVLPFFLACNFFRSTAQEIPDPPKAKQIMQIHWKRKAFLELGLWSCFLFVSSFIFLVFMFAAIRFAFVYSLATHMKFF